MPVATQPAQLSDVLLWEEDREFAREVVTLLDGSDVDIGTVLGIVTASGKYTNLDQDADTGEEVAAGIALAKAAPSGADAELVILRRDAVVKSGGLKWPSDIEAGEIATAVGELKTLGILVRESV